MNRAATETAAAAAPARSERDADTDSYLGMIIFIGAWAMMFAALFFSYGVVRAQAPAWPPPSLPPLPRGWGGLNTLVLIASGLAVRRAVGALRAGRARPALRALTGALALGAAFLAGQIAIWRAMVLAGLGPGAGSYGSVFFALTGFHALHVLSGLIALGVLTISVGRAHGRGAAPRARAVRAAALFWDFIAAVWALMYLAIYVL